VSTDDTGSQSWTVMDMDGDGYIDLVVTAQLQGGNVTSFSPASNQYWKVYAGNGNGFSTSAINWSCPNGGTINGGVTYGYNGVGGYAFTSHNTGSQTWSVIDMNHDNKPDLVVPAQLQGGNVTSFSPTSNQYWKVYLNTSNVGLSEPGNEALQFLLFPNPSKEFISVTLKNPVESISSYEIYNDVGDLIMNNYSIDAKTCEVPIRTLTNGMYFLRITDSNNNHFKRRFIKD